MKKILSILILGGLLLFTSNLTHAYNPCEPWPECDDPLYKGDKTDFGAGYRPTDTTIKTTDTTTTEPKRVITDADVVNVNACKASGGMRDYIGWTCSPGNGMVNGIEMNTACLNNGQCKFKIYDLLGIRKSVETEGADSTSPDIFVQDIVLAATFFIGTVVTIAIIVSGLMFIFAGATGKDPSKAKSGLINSLIGLLIVISSYSIIRLVQYIAKGF